MARRLGGRLPLEEEWERAASWVDGSYPQREQIAKVEPSSGSPPTVALAKANPWGFFDATGCVWQWTDTIDRSTGRYLVKGAFWGAEESAKLDPTERLVPAKPFHQRTGFRVVIDQERGQ
jgi:formylglycine-generating enzyme required for sulfatase activity